MIAPLSYFGLNNKNGFMRITCSGSEKELNDLMNRLETCLLKARCDIKKALIHSITQELTKLFKVSLDRYNETKMTLKDISKTTNKNSLAIKAEIQVLKKIYTNITSDGSTQR